MKGANAVSVIDAASFKKVGSIPVGRGQHNVQVSPDGKWVWVTNNGDAGRRYVHHRPRPQWAGCMPTGTLATTAAVAVSIAHTAPAPAIAPCSDFGIFSAGIVSAALQWR
jgi:DNA-binding beta-propeller fold protein YncE